jgi:hypothetical protein
VLLLLLLLLPQAATASARTRHITLKIARRLLVSLRIISPTSLLFQKRLRRSVSKRCEMFDRSTSYVAS